MSHAQKRAYDNACRTFLRHHPEEPKNKGQKVSYAHYLISQDPSIQRYLTSIKSRPRNNSYLSPATKQLALSATNHFLTYLQIPITDHALHDLIIHKRTNISDFTIDDKLEEFANLEPIRPHRQHGSYILGIFKSNRARLQARSDCHFDAQTKPISESILASIFNDLDQEHRDIISYQAFSGQRINCLSMIPLSQIDLSRKEYAVIHVFKHQNKSRQEHDTIVPKELMQRIIERVERLGYFSPYPDYRTLWKHITARAHELHSVRFTSHYLRHGFHSIASDTPMDVNQWDYLMGSKKAKGHDAQTYNLNFLDEKLIPNYQRFLFNKLPIGTSNTSCSNLVQQDTNLLHLVEEQQQTINRLLTMLVQARNPNQKTVTTT